MCSAKISKRNEYGARVAAEVEAAKCQGSRVTERRDEPQPMHHGDHGAEAAAAVLVYCSRGLRHRSPGAEPAAAVDTETAGKVFSPEGN